MITVQDLNGKEVQVPMFQIASWKAALKVEIMTGMRHSSGSVAKQVRKTFALPNNYNKQMCFDVLQDLINQIHDKD